MAFNHFDEKGQARMVDVRAKDVSDRSATAEALVELGPTLLAEVLALAAAKGDVLQVARLAGVGAVKRTADLIPLAHPVAVHHAALTFAPEQETGVLRITCTVAARDRTGVEMEAMTGAAVAALTVYDMCKGRDRAITVGPVRLLAKSGGASGTFRRDESGAS